MTTLKFMVRPEFMWRFTRRAARRSLETVREMRPRTGWAWFTAALTAVTPTGASGADPLRWEPSPAGRVAPLAIAAPGKTGFSLVSPATSGVVFTNVLSDERSLGNRNLLSG